MASEDIYREWNALQELRARMVELVGEEKAGGYEERLARALNSDEGSFNLRRAVLRGWRAIKDDPILSRVLRSSLGYEEGDLFRLESLPGPETPIQVGPLYCCSHPGCDKSLYQLFDGQTLDCPVHKIGLKLCGDLPQKGET
jgi:hypothetical protein